MHILLSACSLLILVLASKNVFPVNPHVGKQSDLHNDIEQGWVEEEVNSAKDCSDNGQEAYPPI